MHRHFELPFGAEPVAGGVRFRLWAPRARKVLLLLEQQGAGLPMSMQPEADGWFSLLSNRAGPGSRYKYVIDGEAFPDPASRFQPTGVHGASEVIDPAAYTWRDTDWRGRNWEETIVYELHLGTFSESGDCAGAVSHLDELHALGVTVVELMPVSAFPGNRNWGYDGVQLFAPAAPYGRPDDLKALVEACHARGLAVMLDVVYNHFGPEGNYLHAVTPEFFTDRQHTPWGTAINYDGPDSRPVRDFMIANALYWLEEFHFDGLRLDAVHAIVDDSKTDIVTEIGAVVRSRISNRPIHLVLENDKNEARRLTRQNGRTTGFTAQWNDDLHHALHVLVTGETAGYYGDFAEKPAAMLGRALATGLAFQGEPSTFRGGEPRGERSDTLPATAFVSFLQNHDQIGNTPLGKRIADRAPEAAVHAAVAVVLLSPQVPLLFMGEEWACSRPFTFFCDLSPPLDAAVREGRRREFAQYPEFVDPEMQARIPDATAPATFQHAKLGWSERDQGAHAQWLARYRRLIEIRKAEIVPRLADIVPGGDCHMLGAAAIRVDWRFGDGTRLVLLANFGEEPTPLATRATGRLLYATVGSPASAVAPVSAAFFLIAALE